MSTPNYPPSGCEHEGYYCPPVTHDPVTQRRDHHQEEEDRSSAPWFLSSVVSTLKARGRDLQCTIDGKLKQLQVQDGSSVDHMWKVGKHMILSQTGSLEESRDVQYEGKLKAATQSKSLLQQMEDEFKEVVRTTAQLMGHFDSLLSLLEKVRVVCDDSLGRPLDGKGIEDKPISQDGVTLGDDVTETEDGGSYGTQQHSDRQDYYTTDEDIKLVSIRKSLHLLTKSLQEAVKSSCVSMASTARSQLDQTQSATIGRVMKAKCDFDLLKHKMMKSGGFPINKGTESGVAYPYHIPSEDPGFSQVSIGDSSFTMVNSPPQTASQPSMALSVPVPLRNELVEANLAYNSEISTAKDQLNFILEQTSMSTLSCYNVFFSQMATFFQSAQEENSSLAKVIVQLKNNQVIARKLTQERKGRIMNSVSPRAAVEVSESGVIRDINTSTTEMTEQSSFPVGEIIVEYNTSPHESQLGSSNITTATGKERDSSNGSMGDNPFLTM